MRRPIRITAKVEAYRAHDRACLDLELDMVRNPAEPSVGLMADYWEPDGSITDQAGNVLQESDVYRDTDVSWDHFIEAAEAELDNHDY